MNLTQEPIDTIARMMGHPSPEIGGSAAAMLAGLLGLSMLRLALTVSAAKEQGRGVEAGMADTDRIHAGLADCVERDRRAFQSFLRCVREEGRSPDADAARHAAVLATLDPLLSAAGLLTEALDLSEHLSGEAARAVRSDLFGGAALLDAAFAGVSLAVQINLRPDSMAAERAVFRQRLDALDAKRKKAYGLILTRAGDAGFRP